MLLGISKMWNTGAAHNNPAGDCAIESDEEDAWEGTRLQRLHSRRASFEDMRGARDTQLGLMGQQGLPVGAVIGGYMGLRIGHRVAVDMGWQQGVVCGVAVLFVGCVVGYAVQCARRRQVLSHAPFKRLERYRDELQRDGDLAQRESEFLRLLEGEMAELRPFQRTQLIRRTC